MGIATAWSTAEDATEAFAGAYARLRTKLGGDPSLLLMFYTEPYPAEQLLEAVRATPQDVRVHAASSCAGVMTEEGFHSQSGRALGIWGILDPQGAFGVGMAELGDDAGAAASLALRRALDDAGRPGELPDLVWITASPGNEEAILRGIKDMLGNTVPVIGGSAADNGVAGRWTLFSRSSIENNGVAVTAVYTTYKNASSFQSGYSPTPNRGYVTEAKGRVLISIDGKPAAEVYNAWTDGLIANYLQGGNILPVTTLTPIGRVAGAVGDMAFYKLSHPDAVLQNGALSLFTEIEVGQEISLMTGSPDSLLTRAARVTDAALEFGDTQRNDVVGALIIYCAGCMLTVQQDISRVVEGLNVSLGRKPFLGAFTFGEQGCVVRRESVHGNLMISSLVFSN